MATDDVKLLESHQSVLLAALLCRGTQQRFFEGAAGWDVGVRRHRFEHATHCISKEDADRLHEVVRQGAESGPAFWADYAQHTTARARRLVGAARSLARPAGDASAEGSAGLLEGLRTMAAAAEETAPFVAALPVVHAVLGSSPATPGDSDARREARHCYRLALGVLDDPAALETFRTMSPAAALARVQEELPGLREQMQDHVDEYGWLRAQRYRAEPLSLRDLVDRIQAIVLRWPAEVVGEVAGPDGGGRPALSPRDDPLAVLRSTPAPRAFRPEILFQAECIARPFLSRVGAALRCSLQQVLFSSVDELVAGLEGQGAPPLDAVDRRIHDGFTVQRSEDDLEVGAEPPAAGAEDPAATGVLGGLTGCRGRAVGPVKVILDAADLHRLEFGDVLVTAASTTDMVGGATLFPTRGGGPTALQRAAAVVTDEGGALSHAAIVCRERSIPCVLGTERATSTFVEGQVIEVDATRPMGQVLALDLR